MHAALGQAGSAAGVGQHRQIVRADLQRRRCILASQRVSPGMRLATTQRRHGMAGEQPIGPGGGRRIVTHRRVKGIREMAGHHMRQALARWQGIAGGG